MPAIDSLIGEGLNPSPYKEALERAERAEAERDALRKAGAALVAAVGTRECTLPEVVAMYAALDAARKEEEG